MCKSFRWAHEADPNAELYYNDFSHMSTYGKYKKKADKVFNYLKNMTERGCPIHGVGFQAHIDLSFDQHYVKGFIQNMKRYEEIGLKVHITELTIKCNTTKGSNDCIDDV